MDSNQRFVEALAEADPSRAFIKANRADAGRAPEQSTTLMFDLAHHGAEKPLTETATLSRRVDCHGTKAPLLEMIWDRRRAEERRLWLEHRARDDLEPNSANEVPGPGVVLRKDLINRLMWTKNPLTK